MLYFFCIILHNVNKIEKVFIGSCILQVRKSTWRLEQLYNYAESHS